MPPKKRKQKQQHNKLWLSLLEIIGLGLALYLFLVAAGIVNIPCPRNSIFACTGIVRGHFGHIGPFSIAALGLFYFAAQLMLTIGLRDRAAQIIKALLTLSGVIFIAWLRALELIHIREICPWCWGVALVTLIHACLTYPLVTPPMPRLRPGGIIGITFGGFIVLIGLVSVLELSLGLGKIMASQDTKPTTTTTDDDTPSNVPIQTPTTQVASTPTKTPTPKPATTTPAPTPRPTATPIIEVGTAPTPAPTSTPAPTPTPRPTPTPTSFDPEPTLADSEDVRVLKRRGWRHAGSGESVVKAVKIQPPVLMLAYDPGCSDCHRLITQVLDADPMNSLRVTRIAIQESMLTGQINNFVTALPTLILFGEDGSVLMQHVGSRITTQELITKINQELRR